jgi:hypothetical protein
MALRSVRSRAGLLAAAAFLGATSGGRVEAQFGVGFAYPGVPFLYYSPERVPGPTEYLYNRERARISEYGNAVRQQADASRTATAGASPNAYFNRLRDVSGEDTYQVASRKSLGERTSSQRSRQTSPPTAGTSPARQDTLSVDAFFIPGGGFDWPRDAPDAADLRSARAEAEAAVKTVRDELRSRGKATAQSVGLAKSKLVGYGQRALSGVKSDRSEAVADVFHSFLLFLYGALDQAAGAP